MLTRLALAIGGVAAGLAGIVALNAWAGCEVPMCFANAGGIAAVLYGDLSGMYMRRPAQR